MNIKPEILVFAHFVKKNFWGTGINFYKFLLQ